MANDNLKAVRSLSRAAAVLRQVPFKLGEYFANGGPGNANPVVGDRFQGAGNARFAPLSVSYADWKSGKAKSFNQHQKATYGKGSKLIPDAHGNAKNMPILVRTGKLRAAVVTSSAHYIRATSDGATVIFARLPPYAKFLHNGTPKMPARSPVSPNDQDIKRVVEMTSRWVSAQIGAGATNTSFGQGVARVI